MPYPDTNCYFVTVIMPALNEELCLNASVANVLDTFTRRGIPGELIIVNDGSSDRTGEIAESWSTRVTCIKVLHHDSCKGIGASFWDGVRAAQGEIVLFIPGDGENDAAEIFRYLPLMEQVDIVVPFVCNPEVRSKSRQILSAAYTRIVCLSFGLSLNYLNGTIMYRKAVLEEIQPMSTGFFYQAEILIEAVRLKYLYAEVPYFLKKRNAGNSKAVSFSTFIKVFRAYASTFLAVYFGKSKSSGVNPDTVTARRLQGLVTREERENNV